MKHLSPFIFFISIFLSACGGGSNSSEPTTTTPPPSERISVSGTLTAPDTSTPIGDATVFIASQNQTKGLAKTLGIDCPEPSVAYDVAVCTEDDGSFTVELEDGQIYTLQITKGAFIETLVVDLTSNTSSVLEVGGVILEAGDNSENKMAVVTGFFDRMQDVLAKTGFGTVNTTAGQVGELVLGTEQFDLYDGDNSLDASYPEIDALFADNGGQAKIFDYDIVFINCDASEFNLDLYKDTIRDYVEQGGRIYATDWAYDFVEQSFPEFIDFYGDDTMAEGEAESPGLAEEGGTSEVLSASILSQPLIDFLQNVVCTDGDCLNPDGQTIHVEDFLDGWAVMEGIHTNASANVWIEGDVYTIDENEANSKARPLTVSFDAGQGRVIYSSYHTAHSGSTGLLPQERVLQFLVFE